MSKDIKLKMSDLDTYLTKIDRVFPINKLLEQHIDQRVIVNYYVDSIAGYKYFHSGAGAIHMALNYDGVFNAEGYYQQLIEIREMIASDESKKVLELASGNGFNSSYLAKKNPNFYFTGIDLTDKQVALAKKRARRLKNLNFQQGDFHCPEFENATFDYVFQLESVCYAQDPAKVLAEMYRILKPGGKFIMFEGYRAADFDKQDPKIRLAAQLAEKAMAIKEFLPIDTWLKLAEDTGFKIVESSDISPAIMPTLGRLQKLARGFYKYNSLNRLFRAILPKAMLVNSVAGLTMPFATEYKALVYYRIVLQK
ncbi:Methyltransferase, UbiE/COQ5 family protein [uncultured Paludibacter sp.]|uniref:Methyltransferase, UbiE/COQ5 family protein n=1 Tax=uncultured Paludibacter sp. TaxID=497635 RepID=A0A653ACM7_9BACT|nr:Methyltransferase, UbiE/COQ5 family protein [uncultured Paludibacter sp.]